MRLADVEMKSNSRGRRWLRSSDSTPWKMPFDARVRGLLVEFVPDLDLPRQCSIGRSLNGMAGQVYSRQPAKPCRVPAYDCCDQEDAAN